MAERGKYVRTAEIREKISNSKQGQEPWNKNKRGVYSSSTLDKMRVHRLGMIATKETRLRMSIAHKGISPSASTRMKLRDANVGQSRSKLAKENIRHGLIGRVFSDAARLHLSELRKGSGNPMFGKRHSGSALRKQREVRLGMVCPNFNPIACKKIDEYGKLHGYNFQHAENGGEVRVIGYSLDGYDRTKNVVVEYYEYRHKYQQERDERRKKKIIDHLGCKFIEIKEWK